MKRVQFVLILLLACTNFSVAGEDKSAEKLNKDRGTIKSETLPSSLHIGLGIADITRSKERTLGITAIIGYDFNAYMGIEARSMITALEPSGGEVQHYGAFLKPSLPIIEGLSIYGLGGIAKTKTKGSFGIVDVSGLAFGVGLEYVVSDDKTKEAKYNRNFNGEADQKKGFGVFTDYERLYYKKGSPDLDTLSIGITYDF